MTTTAIHETGAPDHQQPPLPIPAQHVLHPQEEHEEPELDHQAAGQGDDGPQGGSDTDSNVEDTSQLLRDFLLEYHNNDTDIKG